jgi:hypothetical protein
MKHKLLIAIGGVLLLSCVFAWFSRGSAASPSQDFSPADFKRISEVTRHRMWGRALPDFSVQTIKALPRLLRRFGSSRIRQIDVLPARTVEVHVESSSGPYYYLVEKYEKSGRWDWRVVKEGIWPQGGLVINVNGGPGYPEIRVDGGFALFGGRISSEPPADWLPPLTRRGLVSSGELSAAGSNQVRLTFEPQPVPWEDPPGFTEPWRKIVPKTPFSASLSNAAGLNLRP